MAIYYDSNDAQENPRALIPDMPGYSDFKDKPFAYMRTTQDQVWWLYWHYAQLLSTTDVEDLTGRVSALEQGQSDLWDAIDQLRAQLADLTAQMCALAQNALTYDVTKGAYTASIAEARRSWQAQMFYGMTVADLATYTVEAASELNVRHVAVDGRAAYMELGPADPTIPEQEAYSCACFVPDEYVKKSDLTLIDTDNLERHEIMGVLAKDAASDLVRPAAYVRKGTVVDLNEMWVRFDQVMVSADKDGRPGEP